MTITDLPVEGEGHKTIGVQPLPISTHIPSLKALGQIFFELSRTKGNPCGGGGGGGGGGGVTLLKPKYPRLSSGDTIIVCQS